MLTTKELELAATTSYNTLLQKVAQSLNQQTGKDTFTAPKIEQIINGTSQDSSIVEGYISDQIRGKITHPDINSLDEKSRTAAIETLHALSFLKATHHIFNFLNGKSSSAINDELDLSANTMNTINNKKSRNKTFDPDNGDDAKLVSQIQQEIITQHLNGSAVKKDFDKFFTEISQLRSGTQATKGTHGPLFKSSTGGEKTSTTHATNKTPKP